MTVVAIVAAVLVVCGDGWGSVMGMTPDVGRRDVGVGGDGYKVSEIGRASCRERVSSPV